MHLYSQRLLGPFLQLLVLLSLLQDATGWAQAEEATSADSLVRRGGVYVSHACFQSASSRRDFREALQYAAKLSSTALHGVMSGSLATPLAEYFKVSDARQVVGVLQKTLDTLKQLDMNIRIACVDCPANGNRSSIVAQITTKGRKRISMCTRESSGTAAVTWKGLHKSCDVLSGEAIFASVLYFASNGAITRTVGRKIVVARMKADDVAKLDSPELCKLMAQSHVSDERGLRIKSTSAFECYLALYPGLMEHKTRGTCGVENLTYVQDMAMNVRKSSRLQTLWRVLGNSYSGIRTGLRDELDQYDVDEIEGEKIAISVSGP